MNRVGIIPLLRADNRCSVLFLIPSLRGGGAERVLVTLLSHLNRSRFNATLAVVNLRDAPLLGDLPVGLEVIDLDCTRVRYALWRVFRLIWTRRPDVVFSTMGHLNLAISMVRWLLPRDVRFMARETSVVSLANNESHQIPLLNALYRIFYRQFDHVICQSSDMCDDLIRKFSFPQSKVSVIFNPIDLHSVRRKASDESCNCGYVEHVVNFVAVGRMSREKGFERLLDAIAMLKDNSVRLTLLGEGVLTESLKKYAEIIGVSSQVRFLGFQPNPYPYILRADALVISSDYEGFPNVALEALACGTPVIATPAPGGLNEIVRGIEECEIAGSISSAALNIAIRKWLTGGRRRVGHTAVDRFSAARITSMYQECIENVWHPNVS